MNRLTAPRRAPAQRPQPIPSLPEYVAADEITLKDALHRGLVTGPKGARLPSRILRRWCTEGYRITDDGPFYLFPSYRHGRNRYTTPAWCAAWNAFVARARADHVREQMAMWDRLRSVRKAG